MDAYKSPLIINNYDDSLSLSLSPTKNHITNYDNNINNNNNNNNNNSSSSGGGGSRNTSTTSSSINNNPSLIRRIRNSISIVNTKNSKKKYSKRFKLTIILTIYILIYLITYFTVSGNNFYFTLVGGYVGFFSSLLVIIIFHIYPDELKPPLELMYWRTWCDLMLGLRFMLGYHFRFSSDLNGECFCAVSSGFLEFAEISSEMWSFSVVIDLLYSITNPFSSFKNRMFFYHILCWSTGSIYGLVVLIFGRATSDPEDPNCKAKAPQIHALWDLSNDDTDQNNGFCWVTATLTSPNPWLFLYIPILVIVSLSILSIYIAYQRLQNGISLSLIHRINILILNFVNISCNLGYWIVLGIFSFTTASIHTKNKTLSEMISIILYLVASKGITNIIVWTFVSDINSVLKISADNNITFNDAMREDILLYLITGIQHSSKITDLDPVNDKMITKILQGMQVDDNITIANNWFLLNIMMGNESLINQVIKKAKKAQDDKDYDDENMKPFISGINYNDIERQSFANLVRYTLGNPNSKSFNLRQSIVSQDNASPRSSQAIENRASSIKEERLIQAEENILKKMRSLTSRLLGDFDFCVFTEYEPVYFQRIRNSMSITSDNFAESFKKSPKKARLTQGGASGALFFVTSDEKYIGKSLSIEERDFLIKNAPAFCEYFVRNKQTYISKVLGLYSVKIFGCEIIVYIMTNLSPKNVAISEKFDIKGSYVKRNAIPPRDGSRAVCQHCQTNFIFKKNITKSDKNSNDKCKYTIKGYHEPIILMKDNDLKSKFYLNGKESQLLYKQLKKDANFLYSKLKVMDYSLLICVKRRDINPNDNNNNSISSPINSNEIINDNNHSFLIERINTPCELYFGIIDFLQEWNYKKRAEQLYKVYVKRQDKEGLSAIEPESYYHRFIEKCSEILDITGPEVVEV